MDKHHDYTHTTEYTTMAWTVYPPQISYVEALTPIVTVSGDKSL